MIGQSTRRFRLAGVVGLIAVEGLTVAAVLYVTNLGLSHQVRLHVFSVADAVLTEVGVALALTVFYGTVTWMVWSLILQDAAARPGNPAHAARSVLNDEEGQKMNEHVTASPGDARPIVNPGDIRETMPVQGIDGVALGEVARLHVGAGPDAQESGYVEVAGPEGSLYIPLRLVTVVFPGEAITVDVTRDEAAERFGRRPSSLDR